MSKILPYVYLLVDNVGRVGDFFIEVFGCIDDRSEGSKPILQRTIQMSTASIIMVQRNSCNQATLAMFNLLAVRHLFITVENIESTKFLAIKFGATISKANHESIVICFLNGIDQIIIHAIESSSSSHDMIISTIMSNLVVDYSENSGNLIFNSFHDFLPLMLFNILILLKVVSMFLIY